MDTHINYNFNKTATPLYDSELEPTLGDSLIFNKNIKYIIYPEDMDGVPIYLGDEVYTVNQPPSYHFTVKELTLTGDGWKVEGYEPNVLSHWKAPKVSFLLMQFMADLNSKNWSNSEMNSLINEYEKRIKEAVEYEQKNDQSAVERCARQRRNILI